MANKHSTYLFYKPYNVLSQFSKEHDSHITLADHIKVEKDVYPAGRLDRDSEGLLLLTNDNKLINRVLHPNVNKKKTYVVQVEGEIDETALEKLRNGISLRINKKTFFTSPAEARKLKKAPPFQERVPPVRFRASIPTTWVEIIITEGKNRQVRKMFAAVEFPVLRLVRTGIAEFSLAGMNPGDLKKIEEY